MQILNGNKFQKRLITALLTLILGVVISFWIQITNDKAQNKLKNSEIERIAEYRTAKIKKDLDISFSSAEILKNLFEDSEEITRQEFQKILVPMLHESVDILALSWVPKITSGQRFVFESKMQKELALPNFSITQKNNEQNGKVSALHRSFYFPVEYIGPEDGNKPAIGFDIYSESNRKATIDQAINQKQLVITPRIKLVQDTVGYSFIGIIPIFGTSSFINDTTKIRYVKGLITVVVKLDKLIDKEFFLRSEDEVRVIIYDITNQTRDLIYGTVDVPDGSKIISRKIQVANRTWEVSHVMLPKLLEISNKNTFKVGGMIFTFLLFLILLIPSFKAQENRILSDKLDKSHKDLADYKYALDKTAIVSITDTHGKITFTNDKFSEIAKYSEEELLGQDHRIVNSGHHPRDYFIQLWKTIASGKVWHGEIKNKAKDGTYYWVNTTIIPFLDEHSKPYQYLAIRFDITNEKSAEIQLVEKNLVLSQNMAHLELAIEKSNESDKLKSHFITLASHEFRTPLTTIKTTANVILKYFNKLSEEELKLKFEKIDEQVQNIINMLDQLETADHIEINASALNFSEGIQEVIRAFQQEQHANRQIIFSSDHPDLVICADQKWVKLLMIDLLSNAIKFSKEEDPIEVSIEKDVKYAILKVKDYGTGISEEEQKSLFRAFFKGQIGENIPGTGLGLYLVKKIVDIHHGKIWLESELGIGSTFTIYFPLNNQD